MWWVVRSILPWNEPFLSATAALYAAISVLDRLWNRKSFSVNWSLSIIFFHITWCVLAIGELSEITLRGRSWGGLTVRIQSTFWLGALAALAVARLRIDAAKVMLITVPLLLVTAYLGSQGFLPQTPDTFFLKARIAPPACWALSGFNLVFICARLWRASFPAKSADR
jgi:hypothetical protein